MSIEQDYGNPDTLRCDYAIFAELAGTSERRCTEGFCAVPGDPKDSLRSIAAKHGWTTFGATDSTVNTYDFCPIHDRTIKRPESSVSDSSRVEIDASRDLATIRLRTATGRLYDLHVGWMTAALVTQGDGNVRATEVPTWEGVPIPDLSGYDNDVSGEDVCEYYLNWWKRGVTDANNATLNGEPK